VNKSKDVNGKCVAFYILDDSEAAPSSHDGREGPSYNVTKNKGQALNTSTESCDYSTGIFEQLWDISEQSWKTTSGENCNQFKGGSTITSTELAETFVSRAITRDHHELCSSHGGLRTDISGAT
jgi:hypothetical protein